MPLNDSSKLVIDSPGSNTLVQNQINQLTELDDRTNQIDGQAADYEENDQSESQIDLDNLTESQLIALQE